MSISSYYAKQDMLILSYSHQKCIGLKYMATFLMIKHFEKYLSKSCCWLNQLFITGIYFTKKLIKRLFHTHYVNVSHKFDQYFMSTSRVNKSVKGHSTVTWS